MFAGTSTVAKLAFYLPYWVPGVVTNQASVHFVRLFPLCEHRFVSLVTSTIYNSRSPVTVLGDFYDVRSMIDLREGLGGGAIKECKSTE
jgi:hypothetical protein